MKKVIAKIKLNDCQNLKNNLAEIGQNFSRPYWQHDRIFVPKGYTREKAMPRLSLRTIIKDPKVGAIYALVMRRHFTNKGFDVVNSTVVDDYTEAAHILYQLGYELRAEVSRRREELIMGNSMRFYIDRIDGLNGYYAKIDTDLREGENPEDALKDLVETYAVLGIKNAELIKSTYGEIIESSEHGTVAG